MYVSTKQSRLVVISVWAYSLSASFVFPLAFISNHWPNSYREKMQHAKEQASGHRRSFVLLDPRQNLAVRCAAALSSLCPIRPFLFVSSVECCYSAVRSAKDY